MSCTLYLPIFLLLANCQLINMIRALNIHYEIKNILIMNIKTKQI